MYIYFSKKNFRGIVVENLKNDFINLLLTYKNKKIKPSENNLNWKKLYDGDNNIYIKFLECCIIQSDNYIKLYDVYLKFIEWIKLNFENEKILGYKSWCAQIKKHKNIKKIKINNTSANVICDISFIS